MFVMDSSASIGEQNYWRMKQFVIDVLLGIDSHSRTAAVTYSEAANPRFTLSGKYLIIES